MLRRTTDSCHIEGPTRVNKRTNDFNRECLAWPVSELYLSIFILLDWRVVLEFVHFTRMGSCS